MQVMVEAQTDDRVVELPGLQRPNNLVGIEDDAGRECLRAEELECACRGSLRNEALPRIQQDRIDGQQDYPSVAGLA